jgi:hypothetical protein
MFSQATKVTQATAYNVTSSPPYILAGSEYAIIHSMPFVVAYLAPIAHNAIFPIFTTLPCITLY